MNLTAIFQKMPEGYIGFIEELPGANTQGSTLDETRKNLREAAMMVLNANRELIEQQLPSEGIIKENFILYETPRSA